MAAGGFIPVPRGIGIEGLALLSLAFHHRPFFSFILGGTWRIWRLFLNISSFELRFQELIQVWPVVRVHVNELYAHAFVGIHITNYGPGSYLGAGRYIKKQFEHRTIGRSVRRNKIQPAYR